MATTKRDTIDKEEITSITNSPLPKLPNDVIFEILSRLPVQSLLRFRCVCKSWRDLFSDPQFIKHHLQFSRKFDRLQIVSSYNPPYHFIKSCSLLSVLYEQFPNAVDAGYPFEDTDKLVSTVGCCNGLVCIVIEFEVVQIFIWNPSTRKSIKLPSFSLKPRRDLMRYGFGYNEYTDDYVVLGIFSTPAAYETQVQVYTRRADSWRGIQNFPFSGVNLLDDYGKFANGKLHWVVSFNENSIYSWVIVSLDLQTETYGEVAQPNYENGCRPVSEYSFKLGVLGQCLSVLCDFTQNFSDIWIMKEYGVSESWCKVITIPHMRGFLHHLDFPPLFISKNGEVLLLSGEYLLIYYSKDGTFRFPVVGNFDGYCEGITYIESLVSPSID